ncbi:hypothetical protein [Polyangium sp. y55x31]|uniref:hypothetical protein n=1 Tax=Polyangium sp. y55x31 TaxID=3042688 RepID=UPI002482D04B|nr:hypothetical protein [Polyangium sp. y55x31]
MMPFAKSALVGIATAALALSGAACRRPAPKKDKPLPQAPPTASTEPLATPSAEPDEDGAPAGSAAPAGTAAPAGSGALAGASGGGGNTKKRKPRTGARFLIDGPEQPIAIGGAATVYSKGVIWRLSGNAAQVTLFGPDGPAHGPSEPERARKWPRGRVAVAEDASGVMHTYWIEGSGLVRSALDAEGKLGAPEVVANDAVPGTSPSALRTGGRDAVAYLAAPNARNAERHGRLWVEGGGVLDLSPEGSGATSISLVPVGEGQVIAMWLDARSAMTPVHARRFEIREKTTALAADDVVFVGGPPEGYPELVGARAGNSAAGLLPLSTDKGFALHDILVDWNGKAKIKTLDYPNGMDTAPVAAAPACGETIVVYARPEAKEPGSPQVLEIATLGGSGAIEAQEVAAYPGQVLELHAAAADANTVWVVYTAGTKSFAMRLGCGGKVTAPATPKGK